MARIDNLDIRANMARMRDEPLWLGCEASQMAAGSVVIEPRGSGWAICIATGPSLTRADCEQCEASGLPLFGVNDAYKRADLDHLYACDPPWWAKHYDACKDLRAELWTTVEEAAALHPRLKHIPGIDKRSFSRDPKRIHYGGNGGFQVMNLAYLMGYTKLIMLGYDMGVGVNGERHFFGEHPVGLGQTSNYEGFIAEFRQVNLEVLGLRVVNATRRTYLDCFERMSLESAIALACPPKVS